jgi:hypothetical protein
LSETDGAAVSEFRNACPIYGIRKSAADPEGHFAVLERPSSMDRRLQIGNIPMAYLNLRDRLLETTFAYVGAARSGKATNLASLQTSFGAARSAEGLEAHPNPSTTRLALPADIARPVEGCDVVAHIRTLSAKIDKDELAKALAEIDGVVVVVDAHPDGLVDAKAIVQRLRAALAKLPGKKPTIVLQRNKRDLEEAVSEAALAETLDAGNWPIVSASALRGEGVTETLAQLVDGALQQSARLEREAQAMPARQSAFPPPAGSPEAPKASAAHPLLTALRRALAETLVEEVGRLETSLTTTVRREISGGQAESVELAREQQRRLSGIDAELVAIRSELLETRAELAEARSEAAAAEAARREAEAREARVRAEWERKREAGQAAMEKRQDEARLADRKLAEQARAATEARLLADRDDRDNRLTTALRSLLTLAEALRTNVDALVKHEAQRPSRKDLEAASAEAINAIARVEQATAGVMARVEEGHSRSRTLEGRLTALVEGSQGASLRLSQLVETTARASQERIDALKSTHHKDATALAKVVEEQGTNMATKLAALEEEFARKKKTWFG